MGKVFELTSMGRNLALHLQEDGVWREFVQTFPMQECESADRWRARVAYTISFNYPQHMPSTDTIKALPWMARFFGPPAGAVCEACGEQATTAVCETPRKAVYLCDLCHHKDLKRWVS